jgi:hypothetical protein
MIVYKQKLYVVFFRSHKHVVSASEKAMLQVCVRLIDQYNDNKK